jgi:hypothetical protein
MLVEVMIPLPSSSFGVGVFKEAREARKLFTWILKSTML